MPAPHEREHEHCRPVDTGEPGPSEAPHDGAKEKGLDEMAGGGSGGLGGYATDGRHLST